MAKELLLKDASLDGAYKNSKGNIVDVVKKCADGSAICLVFSSKKSLLPQRKQLPANYKLLEVR